MATTNTTNSESRIPNVPTMFNDSSDSGQFVEKIIGRASITMFDPNENELVAKFISDLKVQGLLVENGLTKVGFANWKKYPNIFFVTLPANAEDMNHQILAFGTYNVQANAQEEQIKGPEGKLFMIKHYLLLRFAWADEEFTKVDPASFELDSRENAEGPTWVGIPANFSIEEISNRFVNAVVTPREAFISDDRHPEDRSDDPVFLVNMLYENAQRHCDLETAGIIKVKKSADATAQK